MEVIKCLHLLVVTSTVMTFCVFWEQVIPLGDITPVREEDISAVAE
jgi:hypothetical protein